MHFIESYEKPQHSTSLKRSVSSSYVPATIEGQSLQAFAVGLITRPESSVLDERSIALDLLGTFPGTGPFIRAVLKWSLATR